MSYFSKIFQQTAWQILGKVVTAVSTFIILGIVARNYGQAGTGVFTLALTYLAMFYLIGDFGFNAHILREGKFNWQKLLGVRILWSSILVVIAVGLLLFWPFTTPNFAKAVLFGSLAIVASAIFVTCNLMFQKNLRYNLSTLASSIGTLFSLGIFIFLANSKQAIPYLLFAHLMGWLIIALSALLLVKKFHLSLRPIFDLKYAVNLFKKSWPIAATLTLNVIYFRADSFIIAFFKPLSDVGIYNVAYSVFQSVLVLPAFIMNAYYPLMLKSLEKIKLVAVGLLALSLFGSAVTIYFSPVIIRILTGGGFIGSISALQILSLGFPAYFLSSLLMWILVIRGMYKLMFLLYMCALILNLILNLIFIPYFSFIAASWNTVISEYIILLAQFMVLWLGKR